MNFQSEKDLYRRRLMKDLSLALERLGIFITPGKAGHSFPEPSIKLLFYKR